MQVKGLAKDAGVKRGGAVALRAFDGVQWGVVWL